MSVQCVLFSFYELAQWRGALGLRFLPILWSASLINPWFTNPQLFRTEWLAIVIFSLGLTCLYFESSWFLQCRKPTFYGSLLRAYLLAWGLVSWHRWPLDSLETDRGAARRLGVGWIGWQTSGRLCQNNYWLSEQAPGLAHVLKTKTMTMTKGQKMDNQENLYFVILGNPQPSALAPKSMENLGSVMTHLS